MSQSSRALNRGVVWRKCSNGSIARLYMKLYGPDYLGFTLLVTAYIFIVFYVEPFHRMFYINNLDLLYPHALTERVSVTWNIFYAGFIPLLILIIWLMVHRCSSHKFNVTILGFLISIALTVFITDSIKNAVGRPRPDLIARCKPAPQTPRNVLVTIEVCTETDHHILHDGWRSFPSGHSSFAFSTLGYLSLFFAGQLHVLHPLTDLLKVLLAISPLMSAIMISISRCEDYRHDVYDVTCGTFIGITMAYFSYRRYYPSLQSSHSDEPFNSRDTLNGGFGPIKNDEEIARVASIVRNSDEM